MSEPAARTVVVVEADRAVVEVTGSDRQSWLNGIISCDLSTLAGGGAYGLLLNKQGKIQTDLDVVVGDAALYLTLAPGQSADTLSTLDRMLIMEDAEIADRSEELLAVRVHGGSAHAWLLDHATPIAAGAVHWTGVGGQCAIVRRSDLGAFRAHHDDRAWTQLRVERGFGVFGVDYDVGDNPHEAALDRTAVSFSKGCYLGQEVVCMQDMRGKLKRRVCIVQLSAPAVTTRSPVSVGGRDIGEVRTVSPDGRFCLARLTAPHFEVGTSLSVCGASAVVVGPQGA